MRLGVLFSGGKDSTFALHIATEKEEVVCLVTLLSKNVESYMFHTPNIDVTALQAEALQLLRAILAEPKRFFEDEVFGKIAEPLLPKEVIEQLQKERDEEEKRIVGMQKPGERIERWHELQKTYFSWMRRFDNLQKDMAFLNLH